MKPLFVTLLLGLALPAHADEAPSVLVRTASVHRGTLDVTLPVHGTIQAAADASAGISFLHGGQIAKLEVVAGQVVKQGDALLEFAADPAAALAYQQATTTVGFAQADLARTRALFDQKLATRAQVDQADKAVRDAEDALRAQASIGGAKAIDVIRAPFNGIVTEVTAANGDRIQPNVSVLRLTRADGLVALCGVTMEDRTSVAAGQRVTIKSGDPDKPIPGIVASVGGMLDPKTQLAPVIISFGAEAARALLPGQHVAGGIVTGHPEGWIVPRQAVLTDDDGAYLFQLDRGKAVRVAVKQLAAAGDELAVDGPLDDAKSLVTEGNYQLSEGMAVRTVDQPK